MVISELELFDVLSQQIGQDQARAVVHYVEATVEKRIEDRKSEYILERDKDKLLTKADAIMIFATKEDLVKDKVDLIDRINKSKVETIIWIVGTGVLQFILTILAKKFF